VGDGCVVARDAGAARGAVRQKSRRQHEQAVVDIYSVARVEGELAGLVDKVKLALHMVAREKERQLAGCLRPPGRRRAVPAWLTRPAG
jgi:hypothetical protein